MNTCTVCGKEIARRATTGLCKAHFVQRMNTDPEIRAKQVKGYSSWVANPANREALLRRNRKIGDIKRNDPVLRAQSAELMRTFCQPKSSLPEAIARRDAVARGRAISIGRNPWCPDEYRADYLYLVRSKALTGAEARAIIEAQIEADKARINTQEQARKDALVSPFERQERALRNGAALQDNAPVTSWSPAANELRAKIA